MKITYRTKNTETITREIAVGQLVAGIRVENILIESKAELEALLSEKGREWASQNFLFPPVTHTVKKESNWGGDWVDDGV